MKPADPARVVAVTRLWLGTPYHDQASRRAVGCDCLGLVRGVWREVVGEEPLPVPPYSREWGEVGQREVLTEAAEKIMLPADPDRLEPGMLLLFRMRRGAIAKHCGIVSEMAESGGSFIHAYERMGVIEEALTEAWRRRIAFVFQFPHAEFCALAGEGTPVGQATCAAEPCGSAEAPPPPEAPPGRGRQEKPG